MLGNANYPYLSSLDQPTYQYSYADTYRQRHYSRFNRMSLQALLCIIKKLFGCIAALFCRTPRSDYAIFKRICNSRCRPRRLSRCFGNLLARPFQY